MIFIFFIFFTAIQSMASTYPGAGSSLISDPDFGAFLSPLGFTVKTKGTTWVPLERTQSKTFKTYRIGPHETKDSSSFLAVRSDQIPSKINLETYAKKWLRDYTQFGFEYLGTKAITIHQYPGLVVDFVQKGKNRQLRQVIFKKNQRIAIFTCTDTKEGFPKTLKTCNKIIDSFEWVED